MPPSPETAKMHQALKQIVVPYLRQQGFKGSFPHFRRASTTKIDLLSFQFSVQAPGSFYISLASSPPSGIRDGAGKLVPPSKLNAYSGIFNGTFFRLSPTPGYDHAFVYKANPKLQMVYGKSPETVTVYETEGENKYAAIAADVLTLIKDRLDAVFQLLDTESKDANMTVTPDKE